MKSEIQIEMNPDSKVRPTAQSCSLASTQCKPKIQTCTLFSCQAQLNLVIVRLKLLLIKHGLQIQDQGDNRAGNKHVQDNSHIFQALD